MWLNLVVVFVSTRNYEYGIYDSEGNTLYSDSDRGTTTSGTFDNPLVIGEDFKGLIRGLVVTDDDLDNQVYYHTEAEYQATAKFAASFISNNLLDNDKIQTFGSEGGKDSVK